MARRPARWGSPQRLGTAVAVVGYAQAVRGLAVGGSSEVGADPGACVAPSSESQARRRPSRGSGPGLSRESCPRF